MFGSDLTTESGSVVAVAPKVSSLTKRFQAIAAGAPPLTDECRARLAGLVQHCMALGESS